MAKKRVKYVDGFVLPIQKKKLQAYRRIAQNAGRVWMKSGALEYLECSGDDLNTGMGMAFPRMMKLKRGETVVFSWIGYKSRAHRDNVNAKVMKNPQIAKMFANPKLLPFDVKRMLHGGFRVLVDL